MNFNEPFRHPSNLVPGNDNEVQSTHVDDGHAGSQYSDPSLPSGSNGACQYSIRTNDAGGYRNYQNTGSPIFPQPDPVDNQYPQQIDPGDFLSEPIQQHAPQSEGSTFSPSLLEGDMKQDKAEHNLMLTHWGQPQPQPYNRNTFTLPTGYPGSQSNDFNDHRIRNIQHQAIAPYVLPRIGAYEPTLRQQGKLYNTQPCHGYQYFKEGPWNNHRIDPGHRQPNNAVFLSKDQRFEPEAPLSSVNTHQDHGQMLAWTVSNLVRRIDSNEAGCANNDGGGLSGLSDSIPNRQGMQPGIDTFRGDNDQTNNQMSRHGFLSAQLSRNEQSFGQPIGNPSQYLHVQTRLTDTTDAT
ncbi:hypothetical protein PTNB73_00724 [Pyrenophora teres f. teres]|nr:hypothetical protein HRS9122_01994 [Pyrenophora teres f. teres]KAE8874092.1 hypothetical protein PTNB73_00724 [Pyrenophora teres f. teres]